MPTLAHPDPAVRERITVRRDPSQAERDAKTERVKAAGMALAAVATLAGCAERFEVDGARAHARVVHQVDAGPRVPGSPGHAAIADWIEAEVTRLGGRVERQAFTDTLNGRPLPLVNLIGRFGPEGGRRIALCAHWDTRPWSDRDPDSTRHATPVPGANDGGSGVAVLLEVAELMSRRPPPVGGTC